MSATEVIEVKLRGLPNGESRGSVTVQRWSKNERVSRAMKGLLLVWISALVILCVPGLHIVAIPLALFVAPLVFFIRYRTQSVVTGGSGRCPECSEAVALMRAKDDWPLFDICSSCNKHIKVERVSSS